MQNLLCRLGVHKLQQSWRVVDTRGDNTAHVDTEHLYKVCMRCPYSRKVEGVEARTTNVGNYNAEGRPASLPEKKKEDHGNIY